uniref:Uncharacterized protein n=1 Tax=Arundo donax TaxID=35708 RepID=A0A0A9BC70_ARUDO
MNITLSWFGVSGFLLGGLLGSSFRYGLNFDSVHRRH